MSLEEQPWSRIYKMVYPHMRYSVVCGAAQHHVVPGHVKISPNPSCYLASCGLSNVSHACFLLKAQDWSTGGPML